MHRISLGQVPTVVLCWLLRRTGITHYTPNIGTGAIRAALVKKLADENGLVYGTNEIVVTNGAKQAIWQSLLAVCSPGDEVSRKISWVPKSSFLFFGTSDLAIQRSLLPL